MAMLLRASLCLLASAGAAGAPTLPKEYAAVIKMTMPYIPLEMPLRILTSSSQQKIEYYDGVEVHLSTAEGTHKYVFNNSRRACMFAPPSTGPKARAAREASSASLAKAEEWQPLPFFPDLSEYTQVEDELLGGMLCQKFVLNARHGATGTMDDHISFYWDPVLEKPVRWHMHSRHVTFGSHTDEYILDFMSFQVGPPAEQEFSLPAECNGPTVANVSTQLQSALASMTLAHAARARVAPAGSGEAKSQGFAAFLRQHGKSYASEERSRRQAVFERNVRLVDELNRRHAGRATFRANAFLDMTMEEVLSFRGGKNQGTSRAGRRTPEQKQFVREHMLGAPAPGAPLPKQFDWRTARPGVVSPVKDQAMCGSCWTYGLTEPVESITAIRTGRLVELPEQFVVDCTWTNGTGDSGSNSGCDGGDSDVGALEIVRKFGGIIPTAKAYGSYLSVNGYCKDTRLMEVGAKLTGWVDIPTRDEDALLHALVTQGPISIGIMVPDEMLYYDSGVLNVTTCRHDVKQIDHAVTLVGYGTDEHGTDYFTVRNSWSTYWGDEGYIKIARGDLDCCVSCEAGYPEVEVGGQAAIVV